jgi:iron complex transport system ATP-binding protein
MARRVGVVSQTEEPAFPIKAREMVELGRYPHLGPWRPPRSEDHAAVDDAMRRCEVVEFADRDVTTLSAGERQRVRIARALAQQPDTLALDEPTASLDIAHEMAIFDLLAALAAEGTTVVLVTHNINLAARYATRLLLLDAGRMAGLGSAADVLRRDTLERVYRWPIAVAPLSRDIAEHHDAGSPQVVPLRGTQSERHL